MSNLLKTLSVLPTSTRRLLHLNKILSKNNILAFDSTLYCTHRSMSYEIEERGSPNTLDYRIFYSKYRYDILVVYLNDNLLWQNTVFPLE